MDTRFRTRLLSGELLIGTIVTLSSPEVAELLAGLGFDWLFVDTEHAPFDAFNAQRLMQAAGSGCPGLVRVPAGDEVWIKKALDIGAAGVIVPQVNSAEHAAQVVRLCKYPPEGIRGVGIARAHGYGSRFQEYVATANRQVTVVIQIEHMDAVRRIESIVDVPGIDAVLVGPYDLSVSLGKIGQVVHPEVQTAIAKVREHCQKAGVRLGVFGADAVTVKPFIEQGFNIITVGTDTLFLMQAAKETLTEITASTPGPNATDAGSR